MEKIKKLLKALSLLIGNPSLVNNITNSSYAWSKYLKENHKPLIQLPVVKINQLIPDFDETLNVFSFLGGSSLPTDIILLKALSAQIKNCLYFEIGTWRGESVINVSDTAKECYTLNLSKEEMSQMKLPKKYIDLHGFFSKKKENITQLYGNSLNYDFGALNKKFDLIFIDGNHKYEFIKNDTEKVFKHLIHDNSIVVWHDYATDPETMRPEVLSGILDGIPDKYKKNIYHVSNTLCAIFMKGEIESYNFDYPTIPNKSFKITVKSRTIS